MITQTVLIWWGNRNKWKASIELQVPHSVFALESTKPKTQQNVWTEKQQKLYEFTQNIKHNSFNSFFFCLFYFSRKSTERLYHQNKHNQLQNNQLLLKLKLFRKRKYLKQKLKQTIIALSVLCSCTFHFFFFSTVSFPALLFSLVSVFIPDFSRELLTFYSGKEIINKISVLFCCSFSLVLW